MHIIKENIRCPDHKDGRTSVTFPRPRFDFGLIFKSEILPVPKRHSDFTRLYYSWKIFTFIQRKNHLTLQEMSP